MATGSRVRQIWTVSSACEELDPAYLASGALSYVIQRRSSSSAASVSLVAWQAGHRTTLLSFTAGVPAFYDMAKGASPYYGVRAIAW